MSATISQTDIMEALRTIVHELIEHYRDHDPIGSEVINLLDYLIGKEVVTCEAYPMQFNYIRVKHRPPVYPVIEQTDAVCVSGTGWSILAITQEFDSWEGQVEYSGDIAEALRILSWHAMITLDPHHYYEGMVWRLIADWGENATDVELFALKNPTDDQLAMVRAHLVDHAGARDCPVAKTLTINQYEALEPLHTADDYGRGQYLFVFATIAQATMLKMKGLDGLVGAF